MRTKGSKNDWIRCVYMLNVCWWTMAYFFLLDKNWGLNSVWVMNWMHRIYLFPWCTALFLILFVLSNFSMWNRNYFNFNLDHQRTVRRTQFIGWTKSSISCCWQWVHNGHTFQTTHMCETDCDILWCKIQLFKSMRMWNVTPFFISVCMSICLSVCLRHPSHLASYVFYFHKFPSK